jgi:uncharacterized protein YukE
LKLSVEPTRIGGVSNRFKGLADEYHNLSRRLMDEIKNGCPAWNGKEKESYINRIRGFEDNLESMHRLLKQYSDLIKIAEAEYQRALSETQSIASGIGV